MRSEADSKLIMKWVNRLHVKTWHTRYMKDEISYCTYRDHMFYVVNAIRDVMGYGMFDANKFNKAWQYRQLASDRWDYARNELFNVIIGWW